MKYTIEEIRKTQKGKGFWLRLSNEMATQLIYRIQEFNVSPNLFTLISLIFGLLFGFALYNQYIILAAILINLMYLFDNIDGQWARLKKMGSTFGALFDSLVDGWNISIIVVLIGVYLFNKTNNIDYLYLTMLFFILSFLEFALEKNIKEEFSKESAPLRITSLQNSTNKFKPLIYIVEAFTLYDKWIFIITLGLLSGYINIALLYLVVVRGINYGVKLLKLILQFK